jgi:predicted glutamine amidotransferase
VDPSLYPAIEGSADSEVMFFLARTFGLEHDPPKAVAQMAGLVEATARRHGIAEPLQMTVGATDGERVWAFRYSSQGRSRSLVYSTKLHTLRQLYPDNPVLHDLAEVTRLVGVSEPLGDLAGAWNEVPESSYGVVHPRP